MLLARVRARPVSCTVLVFPLCHPPPVPILSPHTLPQILFCHRVQPHPARRTTGQSIQTQGVGAEIATLLGKPADGEEGGLVSQRPILPGFGCSFVL